MLETRKDGIKFTSEALRQAATQLQTFSGQYESRQGHLVEQVHHRRNFEVRHCHGKSCRPLAAACGLLGTRPAAP